MENFDIEKAKNCAKVCTVDGRSVRIICFDAAREDFPIIGLVKESNGQESLCHYNEQGICLGAGHEKFNLKIVPNQHTGFANIYKDRNRFYFGSHNIYSTEDEAKKSADLVSESYIATVKFNWVEF